MKPRPVPIVEQGRIRNGPYGTSPSFKNNGAFEVIHPDSGLLFFFVVSDEGSWDHVSVSIHRANRCPTWEEMCWVRDLFWGPEEPVMQLHPPRSAYVNNHPYTLHLWRPQKADIPLPPAIFVGVPGALSDKSKEIARKLFGSNM